MEFSTSCVCVCERERGGVTALSHGERERVRVTSQHHVCVLACLRESVTAQRCVCVCVRERE